MIRLPSAIAILFILAWAIACGTEVPTPNLEATSDAQADTSAPKPAATSKNSVGMWTQTIFHLTPLAVFLLTAGAAIWRFRLYRMGEPAIKMDIDVTSRRCSESYNALSAVAALTNTGRVVAKCTTLEWEVRVLAPYGDEDVKRKVEEYSKYYSVETVPVEFPWNINYTLSRSDSRIFLEPGEVNTVSMSLALPDWITAIDVQLVLQATGDSKGIETAWVVRCPHDIMKETG